MIAALGLLAAAVPASAQGAWSPPFELAQKGGQQSALAAAPNGSSVTAWSNGLDDLRVRRVRADGSRGPTRKVGALSGYADGPALTVDRRGVAVVVWHDAKDGRLLARRFGLRDRLGPVLQLASAGTTGNFPYAQVSAAVDADGAVAVVWPRVIAEPVFPRGDRIVSTAIHARWIGASGRPGRLLTLTDSTTVDTAPRVAAGPAGFATVAWMRRSGDRNAPVAARLSRAGALSDVRDLAEPGETATSADWAVAGDATGVATFAWLAHTDGVSTVAARQLAPDGVLGPRHELGPDATGYYFPSVAPGVDGSATVTWRSVDASSRFENATMARRIGPGAATGPPLRLSEPRSGQGSATTSRPAIAADRSGWTVVAWTESRYEDSRPQQSLLTRRISPTGSVAPPETLFEGRPGQLLRGPLATAVDAATTVVWGATTTGGYARLLASRQVAACARVAAPRASVAIRPSRRRAVARLTFDSPVDTGAIRARIGPRGVRASSDRATGATTRKRVVLELSPAGARRLVPGKRVRVRLRLTARPYATGCRFTQRSVRATAVVR